MQPRLLCVLQIGFSIATAILACYSVPAFGVGQGGPGRYQCYHGYEPNAEPGMRFPIRGGGTLQVAGFTIEVKPDQNPSIPQEMSCHATIRSAKGDIVFQDYDEGMDIDAVTGKDINGDGQPDAVIEAFSGGAHCCWTYFFVSLGPEPGLIQKFESKHSASFKDLNGDGHIEIPVLDGAFDYFETAYSESPFPLLIIQLQGNEFRDISADFPKIYDEEIHELRSGLNPNCVGDFLGAKWDDICDYSSNRRGVLEIVLNYLYSGHPQDAWKALEELWPAKDRERIRSEILKGYCGGLRAELGVAAGSSCSEK
ncbi:MAG: hypothetical protein HY313_11400 [Acidobacteria bacterium]|nr:hypothetical protein [Acidobacteriota bacterium]